MPVEFLDEHVASLKRVMLPRFPECKFTPEDYQEIMKETGLTEPLVELWELGHRSSLQIKCLEAQREELKTKLDDTEEKRAYLEKQIEIVRDIVHNNFVKLDSFEKENDRLKEENELLKFTSSQLTRSKNSLMEQANLCKAIYDARHIVEFLESERSAKRARID